MFPFRVKQLSEHMIQIADESDTFMFLVQGEKEALLIDTGCGFVGLRETVEQLTGLPLTVALTHMHPDHAGGAAAFEKIYVHPADIPAFRNMTLESRLRYSQAMHPEETMTEADFLPVVTEDSRFVPMEDGQVFDLGGICVEVIHVPGHTHGSCCFLFREERSILFSDACNINTLIMWEDSISSYRQALLHLQEHRSRYDTVYYSHGPVPEGPARSLEDNIELCGQILAGEDDAIPTDFMGTPAIRAKAIDARFFRLDGKYGNICYTEKTRK